MFRLVEKGNLRYYTVDEFSDTGLVKHLFTTKAGGVSSGIYESLNFRINCDDSRKNILANFDIAAKELGTKKEKFVLTNQVHEDNIVNVDESDCGNGIMYENKFKSADGLITATPGVVISTFYADCVPVMLLDTKEKVIATVHSGWRGTVAEISKKAVTKMIDDYNCKAENIIAAIGPSIGECHYEVNDDVADAFRCKFSDRVISRGEHKYHVNMQRAIKISLKNCGVENIIKADLCTYCNSDTMFSHRATQGRRGNMAGFIVLK